MPQWNTLLKWALLSVPFLIVAVFWLCFFCPAAYVVVDHNHRKEERERRAREKRRSLTETAMKAA